MSDNNQHPNYEYRNNKRITTYRPIILNHQNISLGLTMINLSPTGLGATGPIQISPDELVELKIKLPYNHEFIELKLRAHLVHSTPVRGQYLIGFTFNSITQHQQRILNNFIKSHNPSKL